MPMRTRHQHGDGSVEIAGAGAGEQRLEEEVPRRHVQHQRHCHGKARFAGASEEQKQQGERDPDLAVGTGIIKKMEIVFITGLRNWYSQSRKANSKGMGSSFWAVKERIFIQYSI